MTRFLFGKLGGNGSGMVQKLIEIIAASGAFQQIIVHRKSFDKVFP